jgi:hypothetical protein
MAKFAGFFVLYVSIVSTFAYFDPAINDGHANPWMACLIAAAFVVSAMLIEWGK